MASAPSLARHLALSVYLPAGIMAFCSGMLIPIMPLYARTFDASYGWVGVVLGAAAAGTLCADVPAGVIVRRYGHKRTMVAGGLCMVVGILALLRAESLSEAVAFRFLSGIGTSLWGISRHVYVAELTDVSRRGRAIAILGGIGRLGMFLGPMVGGLAAKLLGLRAPFAMFAVLAGIAVASVLVWVVDLPAPTVGAARAAPTSLRRLLQSHYGPLLTAGSGQLFAQMIRSARHVVIPLYAADVIGLSVESVGLLIGIAAAVDMMMFVPAGIVMDRFGRKFAFVPSFAVQALGMAMVPLAAGFPSLLFVAVVIGLGNGLGSGTMMTLGADLAPREARGEFLGLWRFIGDVGGVGSPLIIGAVADAMGLSAAPLAVAGAGVAAAAILGTLVPETLRGRT